MTYDLMNRWNSQEIIALVPFHSRRGPQYRHRPRSLPRLSLGPTPESGNQMQIVTVERGLRTTEPSSMRRRPC